MRRGGCSPEVCWSTSTAPRRSDPARCSSSDDRVHVEGSITGDRIESAVAESGLALIAGQRGEDHALRNLGRARRYRPPLVRRHRRRPRGPIADRGRGPLTVMLDAIAQHEPVGSATRLEGPEAGALLVVCDGERHGTLRARPSWTTTRSIASTRRVASTSAPRRQRRWPSRFWPRSSPRAADAPAHRCAAATDRIRRRPDEG